MKLSDNKRTIPWQLLIIFCLFLFLVVIGGFSQYKFQKKRIVREKNNELAAIASLKVDQIIQWKNERFRDGEIIQNNIPLIRQISDLFNNNKYINEHDLIKWLQTLINNYDYQTILLIDSKKTIRWSYPRKDTIDYSLKSSIPEVFQSHKITFSDLHHSEGKSDILIDLLIPLVTPGVTDSTIFGVFVLRIDPGISLFPIIQSWPTPSKSSETLLLLRNGDSVLYLNELRHQKNTAMRLSFPLTKQELPATKAALGFEGEFEGFDYRHIQVISYLKKIPDSPWFMVAKVDKDEIYSPLLNQVTVISLIGVLLIFTASALIGFIWRNQRVRYLRNQLELELRRNEALDALKESEGRLRELNATKDKFFSIISHDLKSPFNSIIGLSELLAEKMRKKDYDGIEEYSTIIQNSSWRAMDLLSNLIVWSRLQTGRIEFRPELVEIEELITQVTELSKDSARQKNITINKEAPLYVHVLADKEMIYSILRNLVSNAIKFTGKGGNIGISAVQCDGELEITVRDNGVGIEKDVMDKLFRIGESVSTPGTMKEEGTGLGLILCKDFVQKHGGQIWVESEAGKGSRFIFTIPVRN